MSNNNAELEMLYAQVHRNQWIFHIAVHNVYKAHALLVRDMLCGPRPNNVYNMVNNVVKSGGQWHAIYICTNL